MRGYDVDEVQAFLSMMAIQWEEMQAEQRRTEEKVRDLKAKMEHYERVEVALQEALQTARENAKQALDNAKQEAKLIVKKAVSEAEDLSRSAIQQRDALANEIESLLHRRSEMVARLRAFLNSEGEILARFEERESLTTHPPAVAPAQKKVPATSEPQAESIPEAKPAPEADEDPEPEPEAEFPAALGTLDLDVEEEEIEEDIEEEIDEIEVDEAPVFIQTIEEEPVVSEEEPVSEPETIPEPEPVSEPEAILEPEPVSKPRTVPERGVAASRSAPVEETFMPMSEGKDQPALQISIPDEDMEGDAFYREQEPLSFKFFEPNEEKPASSFYEDGKDKADQFGPDASPVPKSDREPPVASETWIVRPDTPSEASDAESGLTASAEEIEKIRKILNDLD